MSNFLSMFISFVKVILGEEKAQSIQQKIESTLALLTDTEIELVPGFISSIGENTMSLLDQGAILISSWGNACPDAVVAVGRLTGTTSRKGLPTILGLALVPVTRQGKLIDLIRSRITLFTKGDEALEIRIQSNASTDIGLIDKGDPIKWNILIGSNQSMAVSNFRMMGQTSAVAGWSLVIQAQVFPFTENDEQQFAKNQQEAGAKADRRNIATGVERRAALFNVGSYRVWLLPPGNSFEQESIAMEQALVDESKVVVPQLGGAAMKVGKQVKVAAPVTRTVVDLDIL
jgi:hypothetical protein